MDIEVKDLQLIKDINLLFDSDIVLYGAGYFGKKAAVLLEDVGAKVLSVCDGDKEKVGKKLKINKEKAYEIISIEKLKQVSLKRKLTIIITTMQYIDYIIKDLERYDVKNADVYSYTGMWFCISLNIESQRLNSNFRENFKLKRRMEIHERDIAGVMEQVAIMTMNMQFSKTPGIFIFQPGKVGSMSLYNSLRAYHVPCAHLHMFRRSRFFEYDIMKLYEENIKIQCDDLKIITLIREPIARDISMYMHWMTEMYDSNPFLCADILDGIKRYLIYSASIPNGGGEFAWFDQLEEFTGIDIFQFPFDRQRGYSVIKKGKWNILVMKLEKMEENQEIIKKFVDIEEFKLINDNIGKLKDYRYIYEDVKRKLHIPQEVINKYYKNNMYMDHFYTEQEKSLFLKKYDLSVIR